MIPFLLLNLSGSIVQSNQTHLIINTAKDSSPDVFLQWIVPFLIGVASAIIPALFVKYVLIKWREPDIKIIDIVAVRDIDLTNNAQQQVSYHANRILIRNEGKTAAENCKAYIEFSESRYERTGWMLPDKNASYTVTLNVDDNEFLDLCAISDNGHRVVTLEYGFGLGTVVSCMSLSNQNIEATIKITSSNARVARRKIIIHNVSNHFPREPNRIVEVLDCLD